MFRCPAPRSGITIHNPEYEWREAARFALIPWRAFQKMNVHEKEAAIAHYRTSLQTEAALAWVNRPKRKPAPSRPARPRRRR